jgi:hypothetical protein
VATLSYSALAQYRRCGYRFYAERVLGLPAGAGGSEWPPAESPEGVGAGEHGVPADRRGPASERGLLLHALLERLNFRVPLVPDADAVHSAAHAAGLTAPDQAATADAIVTVERFLASPLRDRLAQVSEPRREERFAFALGQVLITGAIDVLARAPGGRALIVDYKSDRLDGTDPARLVATVYGTQRLIYALAALHTGAIGVEVAYCFLEDPDHPVSVIHQAAELPELEAELARRAGPVLRGEFAVTETPHRGLCAGCPAEGGLCSWPLEVTRRVSADQLF